MSNLFQKAYTGSWSPQGPLELRALHIDYRLDSGTFQYYLGTKFIHTVKLEKLSLLDDVRRLEYNRMDAIPIFITQNYFNDMKIILSMIYDL